MPDESPAKTSVEPAAAGNPERSLPSYDWLRWTIRLTGIALMFGGTFYLGKVASTLLLDNDKPLDQIYVVIISLVMLGLGIFVLRTGLQMLRSIDPTTISHFSFLFALIYTPILMQLLPATGLFHRHPALTYLLLLLYFGLSYWILKRILSLLLLSQR